MSEAQVNRLAQLFYRVGHAELSSSSEKYFASVAPQSPIRLLELLVESSFWTTCLADTAFKFFMASSVAGFVISITVFIIVTQGNYDRQLISQVAGAMIPVLVFWSASDILAVALKFKKVSREAERVTIAADVLLKQSAPSQLDALVLFSDYNSALVTAPPIPSWIYERKRAFLNKIWTERNGKVS